MTVVEPEQSLRENETFDVLFVCTANICRSPFAERLLRHLLSEGSSRTSFTVESAGIRGWDSAEMDGRMAAELYRLGVEAEGFRSRSITEELCGRADLILAATTEHRAFVLQLAPRALRRTFTVLEFGNLVTSVETVAQAAGRPRELVRRAAAARGLAAPDEYDIADPYGGTAHQVRATADVLADAVKGIATALIGAANNETSRNARGVPTEEHPSQLA